LKLRLALLLALCVPVTADATAFRLHLRGDRAVATAAQYGDCGNPPSTSLRVWLDGQSVDGAGNSTLANNDPITTWTDKGSLADSPTQGGASTLKPTYIANCLNGKACARFDGGDFLRATTAANFTFLHDGTGATVYTVVKTSASALGTIAATATGGAAVRGMGQRYNTTFRASFFMSDGTSLQINANAANNSVTNSSFNIMTSTLIDTATDLNVFVDGTSVATASAAAFSGSAPAAALTIGATSAGASNLTGDVLQVLAYAAAHDATQRAAVRAWAACVYGSFPSP
jgi:hypothetical protein